MTTLFDDLQAALRLQRRHTGAAGIGLFVLVLTGGAAATTVSIVTDAAGVSALMGLASPDMRDRVAAVRGALGDPATASPVPSPGSCGSQRPGPPPGRPGTASAIDAKSASWNPAASAASYSSRAVDAVRSSTPQRRASSIA